MRFKLPESVVSILNQHLEKFKAIVKGILEGDKGLLMQSITLDPLTPSPDKAEKILNKFIEKPCDLEYALKLQPPPNLD